MAIVTSDEQDEAHLYFRIDDYNLRDGGKLLVRDRDTSTLRPIQTNYLGAGATGRLRYSLVDFDRDGQLDLILGTNGYHSIPSNTTGWPACVSAGQCTNNGATVLLMRGSSAHGGSAAAAKGMPLVFEWPEWLTFGGFRLAYGGQETGVAPVEQPDGRIGLIVATPGGRHVFWGADDIGTSRSVPPMQPPP